MALRGFWGFDSATIFRYPEFDNVHVAAATGRDGVANHATQWNNVNPSLLTIPGGAAAGLILGQAWQSSIASTPNTIRVAEFRSGGVLLGFIAGTGDGKLGFYSSAAVLMATSSVTFAPSVWHYLEIKFVPHATTGTCVIHSNELEVLSFTGNTTVSGLTTVDAIYFVSRNNFITDDMYLLDLVDETATAGRPNNDYLGDIRVAHCYPTSDGTTVTMTPSTAGVHAGLVDEVPPNTTDYVSALGGGTVKDLYQVTDLPSIAVTVFGVRTLLYAAKTDAGAASLKPMIRESDGSETAGTAQPLSTSYTGYAGPIHKAKAAGGVFTPTDINALQAGAQVA